MVNKFGNFKMLQTNSCSNDGLDIILLDELETGCRIKITNEERSHGLSGSQNDSTGLIGIRIICEVIVHLFYKIYIITILIPLQMVLILISTQIIKSAHIYKL